MYVACSTAPVKADVIAVLLFVINIQIDSHWTTGCRFSKRSLKGARTWWWHSLKVWSVWCINLWKYFLTKWEYFLKCVSEICTHIFFVFLVKATTDESLWRSSSMSSFWRLIDEVILFLVEAKTTELCVRVLLRDSVCRVFWVKCLCESWWWIFLLTPYHRSIACSNAWFLFPY